MRLMLPLLIALSACTQFPQLDGTIAPDQESAPFPDLVPLAPLVAQAQAQPSRTVAQASDIEARVANLRARANRLRGPVIPAPARARLLRTIR